MARGISLHIGLNKVDPNHYDGWDGALNACENDANDMKAIADGQGFQSSILLTAEGTADAIMGAIDSAAKELESGDIFVCTYSGHGGQVADENSDEKDSSDETWVAYDRQIVDDELYELWGRFQPGVRIFVLSDSCHSGSVNKAIGDKDPVRDAVMTRESAAALSPRIRAMPMDVMLKTYEANEGLYDGIQEAIPDAEKAEVGATVLLISGCRDDQLSLDGFANGLFTEKLLAVWDGGAWSGGGHPEFREAIRSRMPGDQQPEYTPVGAPNPGFEQQQPFTIG